MILNWRHFEHEAKLEKKWSFFFRTKIGTLDILFKRMCKESFEDLEFNSNWKFQTHAALSHKMAALKSYAKHKSSLLIASIVLRQFLAAESSCKIIKNTFYSTLIN